MSALNLDVIAASLHGAGAPGMPTAILAREVPLYEVEFAALEFAEESKLRSADWAVLALARSLGQVSPALVDEYLGLGEDVSEAIVNRLLDDQLLQQGSAAPAQAEEGILGFVKQLLTSMPFFGGAEAPTQSQPSQARKLHVSRASISPLCQLSGLGSAALQRGAILQRRVRPVRLLFLGEPLLFIKVEDERQQRNTQYQRQLPLPPEEVPSLLRTLDSTLSLPVEQRMEACGIGSSVAGLNGHLVRIVPGSQWEVRKVSHRVNGKQQPLAVTLVLAAFPSSTEGLFWRSFLQHGTRMQDCPQIEANQLIKTNVRHPDRLLAAVRSNLPLPAGTRLRGDGAYELVCGTECLINLIGESDQPCDVLLPVQFGQWQAGLRIHAMPVDSDAARHAFYAFLRRNNAALRQNFDEACEEVADSLSVYWGRHHGLPSADEAAINLWPQVELRAALCMRRLQHDLVLPYAAQEEQV
jgi:hypothetical protein